MLAFLIIFTLRHFTKFAIVNYDPSHEFSQTRLSCLFYLNILVTLLSQPSLRGRPLCNKSL